MSVTLATAIKQVRFLLDETNAQFWTNAMIASFLNQACEDIARQTQSLWMQYTFRSAPATQVTTGKVTIATPTLTTVATFGTIVVGATVTDSTHPTAILPTTTVVSFTQYAGTVRLSKNGGASHTGDTLHFVGAGFKANYPAPADLLGVHKMTFLIKTGGVSSQQFFNLEFRGIKQMDEIWGILHQLPAAYPNAFYLWNNPIIRTTKPPGTKWYLGIYPVPATTGTFTLYYYRHARAANVTTPTATILDVVAGYEDVPFWYAIYMAKYRDRDPTWTTAKQHYDDLILNMKDNTRRFTDEGNQFVDDHNAQWPVYLYTDGGGQW